MSERDEVRDEIRVGPEAQPGSLPGEPVRRVRFAAVAGSVVLAGALVAGVVHTVVTVRAADRDAGAPTWKFPERETEKKASARQGLAGVLVPYGSGEGTGLTGGGDKGTWIQGPDVAPFGSDVELGGAQATALRKESLRGLPRDQRKELEGMIDQQRIKGMAARSYFSDRTYAHVRNVSVSSVTVVLARMENRSAVRRSSTFQNRFLDASGLFRKGMKIEGHDDARCFQRLKGEDDVALDRMLCSAYVGGVLVTVTAYGAQPLDTKGITTLVRTQLDRITEPGEAV
ncbi:hypothetical protein GCM10023084_16270 [Streptomyces lacrimifluminis]|uniref:Secreted protein n=1 Tax=Streptomyces lacrimifluminis TaxID=1500077 RepID=A0A917KB96_9ACTN|nr:hypothetical protein [Streptomyces lacrimifluminis]GGJ07846.1 hypothetical protein GCM10012282_00640 [Streptomyces lacrimifluminis]